MNKSNESLSLWKRSELVILILYALSFYAIVIRRSLQLSQDYSWRLHGLRPGWISDWSNDVSDGQWRNFRGNLPILTFVFGIFILIANTLRAKYCLKGKGMSVVWLLISLSYLSYLHEACVLFVVSIALINFLLIKRLFKTKHFLFVLWMINIFWLLCNRIYEGYLFSNIWQRLAFLDSYRGSFRWHICFNFVILRMISFGYDYYWAHQKSHFDQKVVFMHIPALEARPQEAAKYTFPPKNTVRARKYFKFGLAWCVSFDDRSTFDNAPFVPPEKYATTFYRSVQIHEYSLTMYLCYLTYAPLYIAGPIISFNAFASQVVHRHHHDRILGYIRWALCNWLDMPQKNNSLCAVAWYGARWVLCLVLMELITHLFHYNAFALSDSWQQLTPFEVFIIGYGVLNFMWLKFLLIWRYFRFWSLIGGIETLENMPKCINNCYNLESFWKNWHASFNKWLVRYMYIPLGGSQRKLLNVWVVFTFVAIWHDLEWKLLSWAWLTCLFFIPELLVKSAVTAFKAKNMFGEFILREFSAVSGAITITCLMVANLVGYVIGPSGLNWLISRFLQKEGLPILGGMFTTFYVGTKLMLHIREAEQRRK